MRIRGYGQTPIEWPRGQEVYSLCHYEPQDRLRDEFVGSRRRSVPLSFSCQRGTLSRGSWACNGPAGSAIVRAATAGYGSGTKNFHQASGWACGCVLSNADLGSRSGPSHRMARKRSSLLICSRSNRGTPNILQCDIECGITLHSMPRYRLPGGKLRTAVQEREITEEQP